VHDSHPAALLGYAANSLACGWSGLVEGSRLDACSTFLKKIRPPLIHERRRPDIREASEAKEKWNPRRWVVRAFPETR
jgi:hypothetical protein